MVIMERQDYVNKSNQLLAQPAYPQGPPSTTEKLN